MNNTSRFSRIKNDLKKSVTELYNIDIFKTRGIFETVQIIPKEQRNFGVWKSPIAFAVGKIKEISPTEVALQIAKKLNENSEKDYTITAVGPYINFSLLDKNLILDFEWELRNEVEKPLKSLINQHGDFIIKDAIDNTSQSKVLIEFGQPNTHKAFHVGHLKSAITGESIARLLQYSYKEVIRLNYFGDIGMHVAKSTWGFLKKGEPEGFFEMDPHQKMDYIDSCYVFGSENFKTSKKAEEEIKAINKAVYEDKESREVETYKRLREYSLEHQKLIWELLDIKFDKQYPESTVYKKAQEVVNKYKNKIFAQSEGAWIFNGEEYGLKTWVFETGEGNPTYSAKDLGLAIKKLEDFPDLFKSYVTTSVEQRDYFKAVIKVLELIDKEKFSNRYFHLPFGWMLRESGKKFSSRMGDTVKGMEILTEVFEEAKKRISSEKKYSEEEKIEIGKKVGLAGLRFLILSHKLEEDFNYNPDQFLSLKGFSGPYILYTLVRARSILKEQPNPEKIPLKDLKITDKERELLIELLMFKLSIEDAVRNLEPYKICIALYSLSKNFNEFYDTHPVLGSDENSRNFRLAICKLLKSYIEAGLYFLGIDAPNRM